MYRIVHGSEENIFHNPQGAQRRGDYEKYSSEDQSVHYLYIARFVRGQRSHHGTQFSAFTLFQL